jgi:hypothetical protein
MSVNVFNGRGIAGVRTNHVGYHRECATPNSEISTAVRIIAKRWFQFYDCRRIDIFDKLSEEPDNLIVTSNVQGFVQIAMPWVRGVVTHGAIKATFAVHMGVGYTKWRFSHMEPK